EHEHERVEEMLPAEPRRDAGGGSVRKRHVAGVVRNEICDSGQLAYEARDDDNDREHHDGDDRRDRELGCACRGADGSACRHQAWRSRSWSSSTTRGTIAKRSPTMPKSAMSK